MTKIPPSEIIWMRRLTADGREYYITSKATKDVYYIYEANNSGVTKLGKGSNPPELEEKFVKEPSV